MSVPTLYLIPTPLADTDPNLSLSSATIEIASGLCHFIVENEKPARGFLRQLPLKTPLQQIVLYPLHKNIDRGEIHAYLEPLKSGHSMGLISDAGCPGVADPGAEIILQAQLQGYKVEPLIGPSSILLTLMASGLNGQNFSFEGYVPIEKPAREDAIKSYEAAALKNKKTVVFMDTPYRSQALFSELIKYLSPTTLLTIGCNLTSNGGFVKTQSIKSWRENPIELSKVPAIFALGTFPS